MAAVYAKLRPDYALVGCVVGAVWQIQINAPAQPRVREKTEENLQVARYNSILRYISEYIK